MADPRIAARYARALFDLARAEETLERVQDDLAGLRALMDDSPDFAALLQNPSLPEARVRGALEALLAERIDPLTLRFLHFLSARRRLEELAAIAERFEELHDAHLGQIKVEVASAIPMTEPQKANLVQRLGKRFDRNIIARYRVDAALVGGFRVRVGDEIHDYSVATMLESFKHTLMNV